MNLIQNHPVLIEIAAFDFIIVLLVVRFLQKRPTNRFRRLALGSVGIIGLLVNSSGFFCGRTIVEMLVVFGGAGLVVLLLSAEGQELPNQSAKPTPPMGG